MRYAFDNIVVDTEQYKIQIKGITVAVEPKVFDLIIYLVKNQERLISRDELFTEVWNGREVSDTSLTNHIKSARKVLGDSAEEQRVIKTIRGRGYQFIAEAQVMDKAQVKPARVIRFKYVYRIITVVFILFIGAMLLFKSSSSTFDTAQNNRLVVIPFKNLQKAPDDDYLGLAIADQVIGSLSYIKSLTVRPSGSIQKYHNKNIDIQHVAQQLNVDYALMGTYSKNENTIRLNIELINVETQELLWRESFSEKFENLFHIQDLVTKRIVNYFKIRFYQQEKLADTSEKSIHPLAYRHYLRAITFPNTVDGAKKAISFIEKSVVISPSFAPNYVELAKRTNFLAVFNLEKSSQKSLALNYYQKALLLNPNLRDALSGLAKSYIEIGETYKSIELIKRLLALNPSDAEAHYSLGYIYRYLGLIDQSITEINNALRLDPKDEWFHNLGVSYISAGNYKKALEVLNKGEASTYSQAWIATIFIHQHKYEEAKSILIKLTENDTSDFWKLDSTASLAIVNNDTEKGISALKQLESINMNDSEPLFYWGSLYAMLGDKQGALRFLKRAVRQGYYNYPYFMNSSFLDPIRDTQEFQKIVIEVKKKHEEFKSQLNEF